MSQPLEALLAHARALVRERADHALPLATRAGILAAIGPADRFGGPGHLRRVTLAVRAAERALAAHRSDEATAAALALAPHVWTRANGDAASLAILKTAGHEAFDELWGHATDRYVAARAAAFEALSVGVRDELWLYPPGLQVEPHESQFGGGDIDTAGLAAVALAGVVGAPDDDAQTRLEFWDWYLDQLTPPPVSS